MEMLSKTKTEPHFMVPFSAITELTVCIIQYLERS